ncbi:hypothetical protein [Pigmentiphaga soli]|uniref:hypothetical protein n=1 Tax=Pigmentiphaga soli TaxID=1007095 RepID=UPI0031E63C12
MNKFLVRCLIPTLLCLAVPALAPLARAQAPAPAAIGNGTETESALLKTLLAAIQDRDYQRFVSTGNEDFAKLDRAQFDAVAAELGPRLQQGYEAIRLGDYHQQNYDFSLWKLTFKDGGDDLIGTLNVINGRVGGFVLR